MDETWTFNDDKSKAVITDREPIPLSKKLNPIWWIGNDSEPEPPDWYMPGKPQWQRKAWWYVRNPFVNFNSYVLGVVDKNYEIKASGAPADVIYKNDIGQSGFQKTMITLPSGIKLPYISYSKAGDGGTQIGIGWQPGGHFQVKINL